MQRKLFCSIKEIIDNGGLEKAGLVPNSFEEMLEHIHRPGGFWQVIERDKYSNDIRSEQWLENNYTDNGVLTMFKAIAGASTPSTTPGSIIAIDASLGFTTLSASIASGGTVTSISVNAPTGPTIPSGTKLLINPGGGSASLTVTTTAAISGAGSVSVSSVTGPGALIPSGSSVRYDYTVVPTADPSSLSAPVSYTSAMASGQFTYTMTTGYGNRTLAITNNSAYLFSTTGSPAATAGSYTTAWLCNANPISANTQTFIRVVFDNVLTINSTTNGQINITEKL